MSSLTAAAPAKGPAGGVAAPGIKEEMPAAAPAKGTPNGKGGGSGSPRSRGVEENLPKDPLEVAVGPHKSEVKEEEEAKVEKMSEGIQPPR